MEDKPSPPSFLTLTGLGVSVAICIAAGVGLGIYLDGVTHRSPLFTLIGLVVGIALAVATAYVEIKRLL
ncbi:MAG TPA: AtpZ/AtpI family protein [Acidimicrobiales bacterium]|nr:AtpZ/AtpI family protein [Acidimicrobiales bacterium]